MCDRKNLSGKCAFYKNQDNLSECLSCSRELAEENDSPLLKAFKTSKHDYEIASENYEYGYQQGRAEREEEIIDLIYYFEKTWNKENYKRIPHLAISELVEFIMQNDTKESVKKWIDGK